ARGALWLAADRGGAGRPRGAPPFRPAPGGADVFVTRIHARYDARHFPDDLVFQETADRSSFQGRYVLRHPWTGDATCEAAAAYRAELRPRREAEAAALASLTGRPVEG